MKKDEKILKGFDWRPEKRPKGPEDITSYKPRESQRKIYEDIPRAEFVQTDTYFPGYMNSVYKMLASQDSLKRVRNAERKRLEAEREAEAARIADSLKVAADSLALRDSLAVCKRLLIISGIHFILLKLQVKLKRIVLFLRVLNLWGKVPKS